ncbi:MAG: preprotein translocase subunit YajC [Ruminococcaceae bacterium]|nr:preprotein translocase subunit YajC [Oscillospiraceae bacterium]
MNPATTAPEAVAQPEWLALVMQFLPFIVIIAIFYFLLIRPQRKKEKETQNMLSAIKVGDKITTIGGMVGTITKIKDEKVMFETGPKQEPHQITIERWAIKSVEKKVSDDE